MGSAGEDGAAAAQGLRTAVGFYSAKADKLQAHHERLKAELAALQDNLATVEADLAKARTSRDQLAGALEDLLADAPPTSQGAAQAPEGPGSASDEEAEPAGQSARPGRSGTGAGKGLRSASPGGVRRKRTQMSDLMRAIVQVLVTAGRPMTPKGIAEALGRPTEGKPGTSAQETIRGSCKRLVTAGQLVRVSAGQFAIRRAAQAQEPPTEGGA